jgi:hypothetical protein
MVGQGKAGQGRAGQGRAELGRAGQRVTPAVEEGRGGGTKGHRAIRHLAPFDTINH